MWRMLASAHDPSILRTHGSVHATSRPNDPAAPLVELLYSVCQVRYINAATSQQHSLQEAGVAASLLPGTDADRLVPWLRLRRGVSWALFDPLGAVLMQHASLQARAHTH